jgi:probable F420-dependent oxidoreductase
MKYWIMLSQFEELEHYAPLAKLVEECGYAGILIPDHCVFPVEYDTQHPLKHPTTPEDKFPDPLSMAIAMSNATTKLEFATYVYVLPMRHPFPVAKQVATTAMLADYRFRFGIGVGWLDDEFALMDQDFHTRGKRADEMIDILYDLWDDGYAEHHGRHYDFKRVGMFPVPKQKIPIWVGGKSEAAMKRAARCDGAMPMGGGDISLHDLLAMLRREREKLGKDPLDGRCLGSVRTVGDAAEVQEFEAQGMTDALVFPWGQIIPPEVSTKPPRERLPELEAIAQKLNL